MQNIIFLVFACGTVLFLSACSCSPNKEWSSIGINDINSIQANGYLALDGTVIGESSNGMELFLDISRFKHEGNVVLFVPYVYDLQEYQKDMRILSYAMRGVSGDASIVYVKQLTPFSLKQEREVLVFKRNNVPDNGGLSWEDYYLDGLELSPKDKIIEKMIEYYDSWVLMESNQ